VTAVETEEWQAVATEMRRIVGSGGVRAGEPMTRYTTLGVGGPARLMVEPATQRQAERVVACARRLGVPVTAVGKGSNLIVRDGGYAGVIVRMGPKLARVTVNRTTVRAEGGASFALLARKMTRMGRTGLEFGIGIPGSVGGAVWMNAGAFGGEVSEVVRRVKIVEIDGTVRVLRASEIAFSYRRTSLPRGALVIEATFHCPPGPVRKDVYERSIQRKQTQPIDERTFGSTFVNPAGDFAARMIEGCGLKGKRIGGAMISEKHANFIINFDGAARASDVEALIELMRSEVEKKYAVRLDTEVIVIGDR